jgi:hypothetical protein
MHYVSALATTTSCPRRIELAKDVESALEKLVRITRAAVDAFRKRDHSETERLDRELELALGEKERAVGASREHEKEHGCA